MHTESDSPQRMLQLRQLLAVLMRHYRIEEGSWELSFEFNIAVGAVGPSGDQLLPGAMVGIRGLGIAPATEKTPTSIHASEVDEVLGTSEL